MKHHAGLPDFGAIRWWRPGRGSSPPVITEMDVEVENMLKQRAGDQPLPQKNTHTPVSVEGRQDRYEVLMATWDKSALAESLSESETRIAALQQQVEELQTGAQAVSRETETGNQQPDPIKYPSGRTKHEEVESMFKQRAGDQPLPQKNTHTPIQTLVIEDLEARTKVGIERYGTALQPFNGRDALRDAYEEALDLATYLKQCLVERDGA